MKLVTRGPFMRSLALTFSRAMFGMLFDLSHPKHCLLPW